MQHAVSPPLVFVSSRAATKRTHARFTKALHHALKLIQLAPADGRPVLSHTKPLTVSLYIRTRRRFGQPTHAILRPLNEQACSTQLSAFTIATLSVLSRLGNTVLQQR
jgi:hypothetical protein